MTTPTDPIRSTRSLALLLALSLAAVACERGSSDEPATVRADEAAAESTSETPGVAAWPNHRHLHAELLEVGAGYLDWHLPADAAWQVAISTISAGCHGLGRYNSATAEKRRREALAKPRMAWDGPDDPKSHRHLEHTAAAEGTPHADKLYLLYANDATMSGWDGEAPVGTAIVKRTWAPVPVPEGQRAPENKYVANLDGDQYVAGDAGELFVMLKVEPGTPGSDDGWVYALLDPTGTEVRSAGVIPHCSSCHADAPRDHLFAEYVELERDEPSAP